MIGSASNTPDDGGGIAPADGRRWVAGVVLVAVVLTFLPYLYDATLQGVSPAYGWYSWFAYNVSDGCVYLSWIRQYADGAWTHRNLFTTLPQTGHQLNLLFLVLGKLSALTGLPLLAVYHLARAVAACLVPVLLWRLTGVLGLDSRARKAALLLTVFGAGLGWIPGLWERGFAGPVDIWQPEAVTFLSLFLFPLFGLSMALMLAIVVNLIEAEKRRSVRHAAMAGVWGLVLANVHTYDIIPLSLVWVAALAASGLLKLRGRELEWPRWERAAAVRLLAAGVPTALSFGYMVWVLRTEHVFAARVATETLSPSLHWVLLGFGLAIPLAAVGLVRGRQSQNGTAVAFLCLWAVLHVATAYIPVPFQRKMLMGAQWPVALLAGVGLARLLDGLSRPAFLRVLAVVTLLMGLTNVRFMLRDRGSVRYGGDTVRAFLLPGEVKALEWLRSHAEPGAAIQPLPWVMVGEDGRVGFSDTTLACFAPGLTGRAVNAGHWGETPDYGRAMGNWVRFLLPATEETWQRELLRETGVRYLVFSQKREEARSPGVSILTASRFPDGMPYLRRVEAACNEDADVYEVVQP